MLDDRTRRAGERAANARRRAFANGTTPVERARPLGVVPVLLLCLVGAVVDGYGAFAVDAGANYHVLTAAMAAFGLVAAFALVTERAWAWTITWMYLALHVFVDLLTVSVVGPVSLVVGTTYALALTYATTRRAVEVATE